MLLSDVILVRMKSDLLKHPIELLEREELDGQPTPPLLPPETDRHLRAQVLCQPLLEVDHMSGSHPSPFASPLRR